MGASVFPICIAVIALFSLFASRERWMISLPGNRWITMLGVLFFLKFYFAPTVIKLEHHFVMTDFAYEVSGFCMVVELLLLFRKENAEKIPISFLAFAVLGMIFACDVRLNKTRRLLMLVAVQLFLFFWMLFALHSRREIEEPQVRSRRWRTLVMSGVLILSACSGTALSVLLQRNERGLEYMVTAYLAIGDAGVARSGFSNRGGLSDVSSWRLHGEDTISLRIESQRLPGYLRGRSFDEFHMDRWAVTIPSRTMSPSQLVRSQIQLRFGDHNYLLYETIPVKFSELVIWPIDNETAGHCFVPLGTIAIQTHSIPIAVDRSRIVTRPNEENIVHYRALVTQPAVESDENLELYLQLPDSLDPRVRKTAEEIYAETRTAKQKMRATSRFFHDHFKYQMGISIPENEDRLGYFLGSRPAAHCEYFATATVILLRLGGVPARYVTGFYVQEQNAIDNSWLARRKDAHAWVEAYDDETKQWVIVESTPSEGLPAPVVTTLWEQRQLMVSHFFRKIHDHIARGNYRELIWFFVQPLIWLSALTGLVWWTSYWLQRERVKQKPVIDYEVEMAQELIQERRLMDQELIRLGFPRLAGETLTVFARRIEEVSYLTNSRQLADWYRVYTVCRFRPGYAVKELERLRELRHELSQSGRTILSLKER